MGSDPRIARAGFVYVLSYALIVVMAIAAVLWIAIGHGNGIRIWRGPNHEEPSFSFVYADLLQAEMSTLLLGRVSDAAYVRLVAARPRMAFLISPRGWSRELVKRLGDHGVATFGGLL
jgi:hypothetical protein